MKLSTLHWLFTEALHVQQSDATSFTYAKKCLILDKHSRIATQLVLWHNCNTLALLHSVAYNIAYFSIPASVDTPHL